MTFHRVKWSLRVNSWRSLLTRRGKFNGSIESQFAVRLTKGTSQHSMLYLKNPVSPCRASNTPNHDFHDTWTLGSWNSDVKTPAWKSEFKPWLSPQWSIFHAYQRFSACGSADLICFVDWVGGTPPLWQPSHNVNIAWLENFDSKNSQRSVLSVCCQRVGVPGGVCC